MAKLADKELENALEELAGKAKNNKKESKGKENKEKEKASDDKGSRVQKIDDKDESEEEKAAVWLTGGLENEISGGNVSAPVLQSNPVPVESLEDFAGAIPKKDEKKDESKPYDSRMYETRGEYDSGKQVYEETAENLFGRFVKPMDVGELRQDFPKVRVPVPTEFGINDRPEKMYVENRPKAIEERGLSFMEKEKKLEVKKYRKW